MTLVGNPAGGYNFHTMRELPSETRIEAPAGLAADLLRTAQSLPRYDNKDFYSFSVQAEIHERIRGDCAVAWDELAGEIRSRLERRPYCAVLSGLSFDEGNRLFVAINRELGDLVAPPYKKPRAQLVHYIQPSTDIRAAAGRGFESERLHTDSADWSEPVRWISMICVRPDRNGGGYSRYLDVEALRQEAEERLGPEVIRCLEENPVPWRLAPYLGGGVVWDPVLGKEYLRWRRYTIDAACEEGEAELTAAVVPALDAFGRVVESAESEVRFLLRAGELFLMDNRRALHGRTALGGEAQVTDRLMIRSWIRPRPSR